MKTKQVRGSLLLLLTSFIWGIAFVAQSVGMTHVGPFTFTCSRSLIGGVVLIPCIMILKKMGVVHAPYQEGKRGFAVKQLWIGGIVCGILLCMATCFQQVGMLYTTVGKAGFITTFYIIIVPLLGLLFNKKCGPLIWIGVMLALIGMYFLCMTEGFIIEKGDFYIFICACLFSLQIISVDYFSQKVDGVSLSCIQLFVGALLSGMLMLVFEEPQWSQMVLAAGPILYAGVLSSGVAYTLQIIGQKDLNPTVASLIMSLESVISALAGLVILNQSMTPREVMGCVLMFIAIILAQLPQKGVIKEAGELKE